MIELGLTSRCREIALLRRMAEQALERFAIDPVTASLLQHYCNTTFSVSCADGSRYALHIYRMFDETIPVARRTDWIESELWWLDHVVGAVGISAPAPIRTLDETLVVTLPTHTKSGVMLPCVLFRWVDGRFARRRLLSEQLRRIGRLTGRLHEDSSHLVTPPGFCRGQVDLADAENEEVIAWILADVHSKMAERVARQVLQHVRGAHELLGSEPTTFGVIHADVHQKNYLFRRGQVALIDFGDCGWGHYLYDLAVTISQIRRQPNAIELRQSLLVGYREIRELTVEHEDLIQAFVLLRHVQDLAGFLQAPTELPNPVWKAHADSSLRELQRDIEIAPKSGLV